MNKYLIGAVGLTASLIFNANIQNRTQVENLTLPSTRPIHGSTSALDFSGTDEEELNSLVAIKISHDPNFTTYTFIDFSEFGEGEPRPTRISITSDLPRGGNDLENLSVISSQNRFVQQFLSGNVPEFQIARSIYYRYRSWDGRNYSGHLPFVDGSWAFIPARNQTAVNYFGQIFHTTLSPWSEEIEEQ